MNDQDSRPRPWFDLRAAVILGFRALVACSVAWKWWESASRWQLRDSLTLKGVIVTSGITVEEWSSDWPFHNVERVVTIDLRPKTYSDDDVRRLRRAFPGVPISEYDTKTPGRQLGPVKLPED